MLADRVALIVGASRGIGAAIAKRLARDGFSVLINCSKESSLGLANKVKIECESFGVKALCFAADVSKYNECEEMVNFAQLNFGRIDCLINNAGITKDGLVVRMPLQDFDRVLDVNVKGVFNTIKLVGAIMVRQRSGRIVNMSSVVGLRGNAGQVNYSATKAAVIGITKSAAKELGARGILVNAVAPGFIDTDMTANIKQELKEKIKQNIVLKRFGLAREVAGVVSFLCGEDGSYITGQTLVVDGCLII